MHEPHKMHRPRYLELFAESVAARREISRLNVPTCVFIAPADKAALLNVRRKMCWLT